MKLPADLIRWGGLAAGLGGVAWAVSGIVHFALVFPEAGPGPLGSTSSYLIEAAHALAEAGILGGLLGLHARQAATYGRFGAASFLVAFLGTAFMLIATLLVLFFLDAPGEALLTLFFGLGVLGTLVGFVLLGVATLRARVMPSWYGALLIAYPPLLLFLMWSYGVGGIALGLLWLALGYALWSRKGVATG